MLTPSLPKLVSVISLLSADPPSIESPANIDAAVRPLLPPHRDPNRTLTPRSLPQKEVRDDIKGYRKHVRRLVRKSAEEAY